MDSKLRQNIEDVVSSKRGELPQKVVMARFALLPTPNDLTSGAVNDIEITSTAILPATLFEYINFTKTYEWARAFEVRLVAGVEQLDTIEPDHFLCIGLQDAGENVSGSLLMFAGVGEANVQQVKLSAPMLVESATPKYKIIYFADAAIATNTSWKLNFVDLLVFGII